MKRDKGRKFQFSIFKNVNCTHPAYKEEGKENLSESSFTLKIKSESTVTRMSIAYDQVAIQHGDTMDQMTITDTCTYFLRQFVLTQMTNKVPRHKMHVIESNLMVCHSLLCNIEQPHQPFPVIESTWHRKVNRSDCRTSDSSIPR